MPPSALDLRQLPHDLIEASWQRCRQSGLAKHWHMQQNPLSPSELNCQQEQNRQLRRLALREMHLLSSTLEESGRILLLADSHGVILDSQGDQTFLGRARMVSLMPGASWSEQVTGTNAIGMAIIEKHFMQVVGPQHFFDENRFLACHAMPILSPTGHLAGVLDISGDARDTFPLAGRLIRQAVAHIEHDWAEESATDLIVRLHLHPSWLGTPEEGILAFHDDLLTAASSRALIYLGLTTLAIGSAHWDEIFCQRPTMGRQELHRVSSPGVYYADIARTSTAGARIAATESAHCGPGSMADLKDEAIRAAIALEHGNLSAAARRLGVHRSTLYRRLGDKDHAEKTTAL